ncbi:mavicyanin-like [Cucurbita pepo subsp. pepo]|uniref:mavicyanin-like n=1 Tax=Cucurbita pepo subsp. pepo TaxID=3664 RepID=UPI000C9D5052|nr:mavicyanin-like [Cucurbita pepo subsp. pepo]
MGFAAERAVAVTAAVFVVVMTMVLEPAVAAVYKVGDAAGWTTIGGVDYKQWAATKTFQPGDVIVFEYNAKFHNVMRVTHGMYKSCNVSDPIETHSSGNDTITIQTRGHHFFLCGVPGHCQAGQKVDINVQRLASTTVAPEPSALASPAVPLAHTPATQAPKATAPRLGAGFWLLLSALSVLAIA